MITCARDFRLHFHIICQYGYYILLAIFCLNFPVYKGLDTELFSHVAVVITLLGQRNLSSTTPVFALFLPSPLAKVEVRSYAYMKLMNLLRSGYN